MIIAEGLAVRNLPKNIDVMYRVEVVLKEAFLDDIRLELDGEKVLLPWGETFEVKKDFRENIIIDSSFYYEEWTKTGTEWVRTESSVIHENLQGGELKKKWEIKYIVVPPFPEVPPLRKTTWNGWKISGSLWDQRGVKFEDYEWDVHLNIFFKELETEKELEELTSKEVWFYDRNGDSMMSSTWKGFFFERIKYVAEKLGLSDPGMKIKADEQKRQQQEQERRIAKEKEDAEVVETSYYFWKLIYGRSYDDTAVRFKITNGKVYRLYGDNPILLSGVKFSSQISVLRTKKEAREEKKSKVARKHVMEAGSGYTAIYTDRKILHDIVKKDHTSMTCACGIWFGTYDGIPYCRIEKHKKEEKVYAEEVESSFYSQ